MVLFCAVLSVCYCTDHFSTVPFSLNCLHRLQHFFFDHLFNLYLHCYIACRGNFTGIAKLDLKIFIGNQHDVFLYVWLSIYTWHMFRHMSAQKCVFRFATRAEKGPRQG